MTTDVKVPTVIGGDFQHPTTWLSPGVAVGCAFYASAGEAVTLVLRRDLGLAQEMELLLELRERIERRMVELDIEMGSAKVEADDDD